MAFGMYAASVPVYQRQLTAISKVLEKGSYYGMQSFDQDILRLFTEGKIEAKAAIDSSTTPQDLALKIQGLSAGASVPACPSSMPSSRRGRASPRTRPARRHSTGRAGCGGPNRRGAPERRESPRGKALQSFAWRLPPKSRNRPVPEAFAFS